MATVKIVIQREVTQQVVEKIAEAFAEWLEANGWKVDSKDDETSSFADLAALFAEDAEEKGIG